MRFRYRVNRYRLDPPEREDEEEEEELLRLDPEETLRPEETLLLLGELERYELLLLLRLGAL